MTLQMKIHIGNITLGNFEFLETVIAKINPVIAQYLLGIDIMYLPIRGQGLVVCILNDGSETGRSLQQNTHRHQRHDPLGCRTGTANLESTLPNACLCHRCRINMACRCLRMCRQLADDGFYVIFTMVLRNLRNHYVTVSRITPDYFIRFIHILALPREKQWNKIISDRVQSVW